MNTKDSAVHFNGVACKSCGNTLRYLSSHTCVHCARAGKPALAATQALKQQRLEVQMAAQHRDDKKYQGHDCIHLHGGIRYASNGRCVDCSKLHDVVRAIRSKRQPGEVCVQNAPPIVRPNPTPAMDGWVSCIKPPTLAMLMGRRAP